MTGALLNSVLRGFFGSALAAAGFGVLFNVRGKALWFAGFAGGVGGLVYNLCIYHGMNNILANFFGAIALALVSEILARVLKQTVSTFIACALIPLVPGGDAYYMMEAFIMGKIFKGLSYALDMITIAAMLTVGILTVSTLYRFVVYLIRKYGRKELKTFDEEAEEL